MHVPDDDLLLWTLLELLEPNDDFGIDFCE